jgi:hypothetical protein
MKLIILRHRTFLLGVLPMSFFAASGLFLSIAHTPQAGIDNMLLIPSNDGYGLSDCVADGKPCGKIVADAWCQANGHQSARSFGRAASISSAAVSESALVGSLVECRS